MRLHGLALRLIQRLQVARRVPAIGRLHRYRQATHRTPDLRVLGLIRQSRAPVLHLRNARSKGRWDWSNRH